MRVVDLNEMRAIEKETIEVIGLEENLIIEAVGLRGADLLSQKILSKSKFNEIVFLIGKGKNGADGLAMARHLYNRGHVVRAFLLQPDEMGDKTKKQHELALKFGVRTTEVRNIESLHAYFTQTQEKYLVVDAILGTGFRPPLSNYLFEVINLVNEYSTILVSIDIPSGINGSTGELSGVAISADMTLAIGLPKLGHYIGNGPLHSGEIIVLKAGFPKKLLKGGDKFLLDSKQINRDLLKRDPFGYKNKFGHLLIIGGSQGLSGALLLSSQGALRSGTGLITACTWQENYQEFCSRNIPEIMTAVLPEQNGSWNEESVLEVLRDLSRFDAIVLGPGLGRGERPREVVREVLGNYQGPVVLDADGLRNLNLKKDRSLLESRKGSLILTPHFGEAASLLGEKVETIQERPLQFLRELRDETNAVVILKSTITYVAIPTGEIFINYAPNDGMAKGGSGDVLSGVIGGMLAQLLTLRPSRKSSHAKNEKILYDSVLWGVLAHSLAGQQAKIKMGGRGMSASSIIEYLPQVFESLTGEF